VFSYQLSTIRKLLEKIKYFNKKSTNNQSAFPITFFLFLQRNIGSKMRIRFVTQPVYKHVSVALVPKKIATKWDSTHCRIKGYIAQKRFMLFDFN